jgi:hypothetical protein
MNMTMTMKMGDAYSVMAKEGSYIVGVATEDANEDSSFHGCEVHVFRGRILSISPSSARSLKSKGEYAEVIRLVPHSAAFDDGSPIAELEVAEVLPCAPSA